METLIECTYKADKIEETIEYVAKVNSSFVFSLYRNPKTFETVLMNQCKTKAKGNIYTFFKNNEGKIGDSEKIKVLAKVAIGNVYYNFEEVEGKMEFYKEIYNERTFYFNTNDEYLKNQHKSLKVGFIDEIIDIAAELFYFCQINRGNIFLSKDGNLIKNINHKEFNFNKTYQEDKEKGLVSFLKVSTS